MKLLRTKINGLYFWYRSDDKFVGQRIAAGKYEEYETKLILSQVNSESIAIDVGANIGYYTILLAQKCKKVYAIEPDKKCFEILRKNVESNGLKNIVLLNVAASSKREKRTLIADKNNLGNSRLNGEDGPASAGKDTMVICERLDDILQNEQKISLIKVDTQGWEPEVIEGAKIVLEKHHPILFLEYTPSEYRDGKMIDYLESTYRFIRSIDYWFFIARKGIIVNKKTGYVDLWLSNRNHLLDIWNKYRHVQIKKVIRWVVDSMVSR